MSENDDPETRYNQAKQRVHDSAEEGKISPADETAIQEYWENDDRLRVRNSSDARSIQSTANYVTSLLRVDERIETSLVDLSEDDLDTIITQFLTGHHSNIKDGGLSAHTVNNYACALRAFYDFHDFGVDPTEIELPETPDSAVDDREVFDSDDIQRLRDASMTTRDRAMFEMLINTGQRVRALQTLRVRDVKPEEGIFYLNEEEGGLKGAEGKRPLLGAQDACYQLMQEHPTGEPDDYFFTVDPNNPGRGTPGEKLSQVTFRTRLKKLVDAAGINKPANPHNFRHTFVTIAVKNYGLDRDRIKEILGHGLDSNVMEVTYTHLTDDDTIEAAEKAWGIREDETESPLSPQVCPRCQNNLSQNARACDRCGMTFTPDAHTAEQQLDDMFHNDAKAADPESDDGDDLDNLRKLAEENPQEAVEIMAEIMNDD